MLSFAESAALDEASIDPANSENAVINAVMPMPTQPPMAVHMLLAAAPAATMPVRSVPSAPPMLATPNCANANAVPAFKRIMSKNAINGPFNNSHAPSANATSWIGVGSPLKNPTMLVAAFSSGPIAVITPSNAMPTPTSATPRTSMTPESLALSNNSPSFCPSGASASNAMVMSSLMVVANTATYGAAVSARFFAPSMIGPRKSLTFDPM